jgi:alkyl sulfatase BDS1-like metallo-beta-lactamase superfamily hydrolase
MREIYGGIAYIIRDLYREETGWWQDRNPTSLHPLVESEAASAVLDAIVDKQAVLEKARSLAAEGKTQRALHVVDLLALAPGSSAEVVEARTLKAALCRERSKQVSPYVSKALFESSARRIESDKQSWLAD